MRPMISCVYALTDPADGRIYYVGAAIHFYRRVSQHLSSNPHGPYFKVGANVSRWVVRLLTVGRTPQSLILEADPPDGLERAEQRWITHCLARQEPLLNTIRRGRPPKRPQAEGEASP
jgi:GIY-YIG catalytic domain